MQAADMSRHEIQLMGLNLVCADIDATLTFLRRAGMAIPDDGIWRTATGPHHVNAIQQQADVEIELDSPTLAGRYNAGYVGSPSAGAVVIGFRVLTREAVDEVHARLTAAGHPSRQPPYDAFWGARYAIVADPDGRDIGFMSPSDPARRSTPPAI
jgi:catechol 2,3-dioxygenase-like lactoylglutathione lyase family enzyme